MEKFKSLMRNAMYAAAWLLAIVPPFIAGVCCKEFGSSNFEKVIGWITMVVVVILAAVMLWLKHKGRLFNGKNDG